MTAIRPLDLKVSVMIRIAMGAVFCSLIAAIFVISETHLELSRNLESKSRSFGNYLSLQAFRTDAGSGRPDRFPDWQFVSEQLLDDGLCVQVSDLQGQSMFASCRGSE